jgi:hypothetical protein
MTIPQYRTSEPLYTVIYRDPAARTRLISWTNTSQNIQARVDDNRMHLFDHNTFNLFLITWSHGWDNLMVWDPWAKRHINI